MKKWSGWILKGIYEYLLVFPLLLMIGLLLMDEHIWIWLPILIGGFIVGLLIRTIIPHAAWWVYGSCSLIISFVTSLLFTDRWYLWILLTIVHFIVIYRGIVLAGDTQLLRTEFLWFGGLGLYFVGYFFFRYVEGFQPYLQLIQGLGILTVIITMFVTNDENLKSSTLSKKQKPFISRAIKTQNRFFLTLTIIAIALVTYFQAIREGLLYVIRAFFHLLFSSKKQKQEPVIEEPPPSMDFTPPIMGERKTSAFAEFLDTVITYFGYFMTVVAIIALSLLLIKKVRQWVMSNLRKLIHLLKQLLTQSIQTDDSIQYVDEKESIFNWDEWKKEQQAKAKGIMKRLFHREPRWETLTNQEKTRYVYRKWVSRYLKDIQFHPSLTPRETINQIETLTTVNKNEADLLKNAYEKSRYGEQTLDEKDLESMYRFIKDN